MIETVDLPPDREHPSSQPLDTSTLNAAAHQMQQAFDLLVSNDPKLAEILKKVCSDRVKMVVFGGWARDRLFEFLHRTPLPSRDLDFVVDSTRPIAEFFPRGARENPFGGVGIQSDSGPLEAWNLQNTFLFQRERQAATFDALPATADYDVNALLFFPAQCHGVPALLDRGAGMALKSRRLDFMADVVAQPKIQAARAVILATKLQLAPSETVCDFVQDVCEDGVTAQEVQRAIGTYCPREFQGEAQRLLAQIRQGNMGGRPKTEFFFHCWGVFEGGGVRAAAHAGAYTAARRAGVTFGRVAGTSGGSIVAALVAAGASPSYLKHHLQTLDFLPLLDTPNKKEKFFEEKLPLWARLLRPVTWGRLRKAADVATYGGLHGSNRLGDWVEQRLVELVRPGSSTTKKPVLFSELPIPLYVVATDFSTGQPKVWSSESAGEESVALAVRHSCTIPFFFQPIRAGSSILLDGGAVSNLPAYVLNQQSRTSGERDVLSRILAFRLVEDDTGSKPVRDVVEFGRRLSAAVIDSASEIQLKLQPNVYPVQISTGSIRSTDFDRIGPKSKLFLYGRGVKGAREFFRRERLTALRADATAQEFQGFDEKMLLLVRQTHACRRTFLASGRDTYWLDHVFPSLLLLARRGVAVIALVSPLDQLEAKVREQEERRRKLLTLLGGTVTLTTDGFPFTGFAFDLGTNRASTILTYLPDGSQAGSIYEDEKVRLYTSDSDPVVVDIVTELVSRHIQGAVPSPLQLAYAPCAAQKLIDRLLSVPTYQRASIETRRIPVTRAIFVMQRRIKEFKALQVRSFMSDLAEHGYSFFASVQVQLQGGKSSIVTPPVFEQHAGSLVVIEGNARLHHCFTNGIDEIEGVVVEGVTDRLPSDGLLSLGNLRLVSSTVSMAQNYQNLRPSEYRHIERAVHENYD
ncbi:patatin-like phospholipase family protein [Ramlibacter alkalitolerans]|uniref:Patatin-like phospholipase family protein n=1 Tax=Ramlibacter alkalitolerans TaxID=2039631 RepID=A0ABS1JVQ8_9BURK|nr:patatin-like phospholipase family protein [Ramlibacter alkalitolerans]MBL0427951.1 patatin-like phospholipase family protein [Ramlibacter alkalitolerans]